MAIADLRQHSLGVLDANQVVCTDRFPQRSFTQVLVLVLAQPGDGLEILKKKKHGHKNCYYLNKEDKEAFTVLSDRTHQLRDNKQTHLQFLGPLVAQRLQRETEVVVVSQ